MLIIFFSIVIFALLLGILAVLLHSAKAKRQTYIDLYTFTPHQLSRVKFEYPHLKTFHLNVIARGLKTFFLAHLHEPHTVHAMPSKAVDALWHAFILDTTAYHAFCQNAFGSYFHHIPSSRMDERDNNEAALERIWRFACRQQGLNPMMTNSLPALFAIDAALDIPDGLRHEPAYLVGLSREYDRKQAASNGDSGSSGDCGDSSSGCGGGCGGGD